MTKFRVFCFIVLSWPIYLPVLLTSHNFKLNWFDFLQMHRFSPYLAKEKTMDSSLLMYCKHSLEIWLGFPIVWQILLAERIKEGLHFGQLVIGVKAIYNLDEDIFAILKHIPCHWKNHTIMRFLFFLPIHMLKGRFSVTAK